MKSKNVDFSNRDSVRQYRSFGASEMEAKDNGFISGRAITFDVVDDIGGGYYELIERSAINKTDMSKISLYIEHVTSSGGAVPLASYRENDDSSTLKIDVRNEGVYFETFLDIENNPRAAEVYSAIKRKDLGGASFGFMWEWESGLIEEFIDGKLVHVIKDIEFIDEISLVANPAYDSSYVENRSKVLDAISIKKNKTKPHHNKMPKTKSRSERKRERLLNELSLKKGKKRSL